MSGKATGKVHITADALIHLRTHSPLARRLAVDCSYDRLFLTEAGEDLAQMALSLDPVYEQFNLVRYAWFAQRMSALAARHAQMVILGAGYDTRSLTLPALRGGGCRVFEVDLPDVLSVKQRVLAAHGVAPPPSVRFVPCDLNAGGLGGRLAAAGFDAAAPSAVVMEGVFFFLQGERAAALLDPASIGLARGNTLVFDAWTAGRVQRLNHELVAKTGRPLFGEPSLGNTARTAAAAMRRLGYRGVTVTTLDEIARQYGADEIEDPVANSWLVIDARVA